MNMQALMQQAQKMQRALTKKNDELNKWFGCTKCLYTSCHDLISRYLMFD